MKTNPHQLHYRQQRKDENMDDGIRAQSRFMNVALHHGYTTRTAPSHVDRNQHIDLYLYPKHTEDEKIGKEIDKKSQNQTSITVDVKAVKHIDTQDEHAQDEWMWIELHGVNHRNNPDNKGWLYGGKADWIAFERRNAFIIVERSILIEVISEYVDTHTHVLNPYQAFYTQYYRHQCNGDILTLIHCNLLQHYATHQWPHRLPILQPHHRLYPKRLPMTDPQKIEQKATIDFAVTKVASAHLRKLLKPLVYHINVDDKKQAKELDPHYNITKFSLLHWTHHTNQLYGTEINILYTIRLWEQLVHEKQQGQLRLDTPKRLQMKGKQTNANN